MAKKKADKDRMECAHCKRAMTNAGPCCDEHRDALAKESFNLCTVCGGSFETKKELVSHSHQEAA